MLSLGLPGLKGPQGETGPPGQGAPGITGEIGIYGKNGDAGLVVSGDQKVPKVGMVSPGFPGN